MIKHMRRETHYPGEAEYHYDREKREEGLSNYAVRNLHTQKSIFRHNRSLTITLIDVAALILLVSLVSIFLRTRPASTQVGISVTGEAFRLDDRIIASVTIERLEESAPSGEVRVVFRVLPGSSRSEVHDLLPEVAGEKRTIRSSMPYENIRDDIPSMVFATIYAGGERSVVTIDVDGEPSAGESSPAIR